MIIHSTVDRYLHGFQIGSLENNAVVNILEYVFGTHADRFLLDI